ncbi:hypothetical protein DERF_010153 [Dermatophagoides farinae]|uniref:Uncharacterized protein n=1 Tax=Dermatophagoides farinae TaxID=6954 RepID=A0A922HYQ8_DERFA|nr:hypothetical protein DERF_010153 [Dermatophagoides farinae]
MITKFPITITILIIIFIDNYGNAIDFELWILNSTFKTTTTTTTTIATSVNNKMAKDMDDCYRKNLRLFKRCDLDFENHLEDYDNVFNDDMMIVVDNDNLSNDQMQKICCQLIVPYQKCYNNIAIRKNCKHKSIIDIQKHLDEYLLRKYPFINCVNYDNNSHNNHCFNKILFWSLVAVCTIIGIIVTGIVFGYYLWNFIL